MLNGDIGPIDNTSTTDPETVGSGAMSEKDLEKEMEELFASIVMTDLIFDNINDNE